MSRDNRRGSILIVALWVMIFLSIIAVNVGFQVRQRISLLQAGEERAQAYYLARSGVFYAIQGLVSGAWDSVAGADSRSEPWALSQKDELLSDLKEGRFILNAEPSSDQGKEPCLRDEDAKLNINHATRENIERLLREVTDLDKDRVSILSLNIYDWKDPDSVVQGLNIPRNEESVYSDRQDSVYRPRNDSYVILEELLMVDGMTERVYNAILPYITVYTSGKTNINTAPKAVLTALGLNSDLSEKMVSMRNGFDGMPATADDLYWVSLEDFKRDIERIYDLNKTEREEIDTLISSDRLSLTSDVFRTTSFGELYGRNLHGKIVCIFDRAGRVLFWETGFYYDN